MSNKNINVIIQHRSATRGKWMVDNPLLLKGEIGIEIDTGKFKIGDGIKKWNHLSYVLSESVEHVQTSVEMLQEEIVSKFTLLNTINNRSLKNESMISAFGTRQIATTVAANAWVGNNAPYIATVPVFGVSNNVSGSIGLSDIATITEREVARNAMISPIPNTEINTIKLVADGDKPKIPLPIIVTIWK